MRINTNLTAMNTFTQYTKNNNKIADSVEKLSSGYAINSAADNAAGLAISEKMRAQIRGLEQASVNSQDAISLIQTAEGGLNESTEILQRMRELAVQSANDTNENEIDREALQDEFSQLQEELNNIANTTTFNKKNLLDGSLAKKQATTANLALQNSGLSVSLGNAAAGNYSFETVVKVESATVKAEKSDFTAVSSDDKISIVGNVTNNMAASSLANGNYEVEASWNSDTKEMVFTAKGDNGQSFTATLSKDALDKYAKNPAGEDLTLKFGNGNAEAFEVKVDTATKYSTSNDATMETVAKEFSDALSFAATGGVDYKEATYGLYATMTGAEDIKLEAGMSSVTFSNGISVSFDELTVSDVTVDEKDAGAVLGSSAATTIAAVGTATYSSTTTWDAGAQITINNFVDGADAAATTLTTASTFTSAAVENGNGTITVTLTSGGNDYSATLTADQLTTLKGSATNAGGTDPKLTGITFTGAGGKSFTADISNTVSAPSAGAYNNTHTLNVQTITANMFNQGSAAALGGSSASTFQGNAVNASATGTTNTTKTAKATLAYDKLAITNNNLGLKATDTITIGALSNNELIATIDGTDYKASVGAAELTKLGKGEKLSLSFKSAAGVEAFTVDLTSTLEFAAGDLNKEGTATISAGDITAKQITLSAAKGDATFEQKFGIVGGTQAAPTYTHGASTFDVEVEQGAGLTFQIGANQGDELVINVDRMDAEYLGVASADVLSRESATDALSAVDKALNQVASQRAYLGAMQNRLDHKIANLDTSAENLTAAEGQIRDVDMAKQMTEFTNANILSQAATAMLAQANSLPQNVLSLIG